MAVPPTIDSLPATHTQPLGKTMMIMCLAKGNPEPEVTWYKGGEFAQSGRTLWIENVTTSDLGIYTCRASNGFAPDDVESVEVAAMSKAFLLLLFFLAALSGLGFDSLGL